MKELADWKNLQKRELADVLADKSLRLPIPEPSAFKTRGEMEQRLAEEELA